MFGIAYRILGSVHDAQDAVQDSLERWLSLSTGQRSGIVDPQGWLVRVLGRLCLDQAGSARRRRETYPGIWLPEPIIGTSIRRDANSDPERAAELSESVSIAMLSAMERLSPIERVCLILHDVFRVPYAEIASITDRSSAACKQAAASARAHLAKPTRYTVSNEERTSIVVAFKNACESGDFDALVRLLAPDVASQADGGSTIRVAGKPVIGATRVARYLLTLVAQQHARTAEPLTIQSQDVNGRTGITIAAGTTLIAVLDLAIRDGLISQIALIVAPEKLG